MVIAERGTRALFKHCFYHRANHCHVVIDQSEPTFSIMWNLAYNSGHGSWTYRYVTFLKVP